MMDYRETLEYLMSQLPMYQRIGAAAYRDNLSVTLALDEAMGHPHQGYRTIHVAGTNGKGSVSHMLASVLQSAGYRTGLYTSPHLKDYRERIRINGQVISEDFVTGFVNRYRHLFDSLKPSFFEMTVALAFEYFAGRVDVAVIETGMGGRLDSTNIIEPVLSVITNIGLDHTRYLGDSLEKIALEKAGIIKEKIPVVIGETQEETRPVFGSVASGLNSALLFADQRYTVDLTTFTGRNTQLFYVSDTDGGRQVFECDLAGLYQKYNLVCLLMAVDVLNDSGFRIGTEHLAEGLAQVRSSTGLRGRWECLGYNPLVIADIGHNAEGIRQVLSQLRQIPFKKLHFVIGMVNDKDTGRILSLLPVDASYYFTQAAIPRALDAKLLMEKAGDYDLQGSCYPTVMEAFENARKNAAGEDLVFIGGSAFVVAEVL